MTSLFGWHCNWQRTVTEFWCDLTKLLGGENFWRDAEDAIRTRTIRFIYVLSRRSNEKEGPRNELQIAKNVFKKDTTLHDFIIPLHVDDLPHGEINVLLTSINAIPFERGWAKGYAQLLEVLERENVAKKPNFNPAAVLSWWRTQFSAERGVKREADTYHSNFLRATSFPQSLWLHTLVRSTTGPVQPEHRLNHAGFIDGIDLVTLASADDIVPSLGEAVSIVESNAFNVCDLIQGKTPLTAGKGRYFLSRLLKECWERWIGTTELGTYALANQANCYFFRKGKQQPNVEIHFTNPEGKQTYRGVVGYATQADDSKRYWHFAIQAHPIITPSLGYLISSHVIFTDDGVTPWSSHKRMHSARRRQCKSWFNPEWRDRLLATLYWLSQGNPTLSLPAGSEALIELSSTPDRFDSEISYTDPPTRKQRSLLSVSEHADTASTEDVEVEEDEEDEDEQDIEEQQ